MPKTLNNRSYFLTIFGLNLHLRFADLKIHKVLKFKSSDSQIYSRKVHVVNAEST